MTNVSGYIDAPIVYDPQSMAQAALNNLMNAIPGWSPREGNLDVLLIEEFAQMASEAASAASSIPSSIFKYYGSLVGIPQNTGVNATIQTQWTLVAPVSSFTVPAGTIAGFYWQGVPYQYQTLVDVTFTSPTVTQTIVMEAVAPGYNYGIDGLGVTSSVFLSTSPTNPYIASIAVTGTPGTNSSLTLGVDPETDSAYLNRLSFELALLAPRPITPNDYAQMSQNVPPAYRAAAIDGIDPYGNLLTNNDANLTTAITNNYGVVGSGSPVPTASLTGGALQITPASMPSATTSTSAVTTSSTSIAVTTAALTTAVSPTNPAIILVSDTATMTATTTLGSAVVTSSTTPTVGQQFTGPGIPAGTTILSVGSGTFTISNNATSATSGGTFTYGFGNEIVVVTSVGGTSNKTWTLQSGTKFVYPHASGVTLTVLQGVIVPNVPSISPNTAWLQTSAVVKTTDTSPSVPVRPYIVSVASYYDGTVRTFSSQFPLSDGLYDYSTNYKTIFCNIPAFGGGQLAPESTQYASFTANVTSVQSYIVWKDAIPSKAHNVFYSALQASVGDLTPVTGRESILYSGSDGNYIPDSTLLSYAIPSGSGSSWALDSGLVGLPGIGVQVIGTGSAIGGSGLKANSQAFNMPNIAGTQFTAYASIDTTYATAGTVTLKVFQVGNATALGTASTSTFGVNNLVINFSIPATSGVTAEDLYVQVSFDSTLSIITGSSVIASNFGLIIGNYTDYQSIVTFGPDVLYYWTAGGQYIPNAFNYSRTVAVAPVTSTGFPLEIQDAENVVAYLDARREANFNVYAMQPNYVPINVSWSAVCLPGFDPNVVQAAGTSALISLLSPANWAGGLNTPPYWDTTRNTVRVLDIAGTLSQVQGVATVISVTMSAGTLIGSLSATDIAMPGIAPLPVANNITGSVIANGTNSTIGGI